MIRKTLLTVALTAGMVTGTSSAAVAHECFNASRSATGNANATHSDNWETLTLKHLYETVHGFVGGRPLTAQEVDKAVETALGQGVPPSFTVFHGGMLPGSLETKAPSAKSSDGKGIDHFASGYGDTLIKIYVALISAPGE